MPVLADDAALEALLGRIPPDPAVDIVVVDGGSSGRLEALVARRPDLRLVRTPPGRARQMNAGAAIASGEWLLFLHADSVLPAGWLRALEQRVGDAIGGWFQFALDDPAWQARWIERGVRLRNRLFRLPYGDQGIFVRRTTFSAMGGYREIPIMEDVEIVRRLHGAGRMVELPLALTTSARRWRRDGWLRRSTLNVALVTLYLAGLSPERLARWYSR